MPDARLEQARKTLPHGYQFGDGRFSTVRELAAAHFIARWHARHTQVSRPDLLLVGEYLIARPSHSSKVKDA